MHLLAPFIRQNFKKIFRADLELWRCAILGPKMAHLSWTKLFWYQLLLLSSIYWTFSLCKILEKFLQQIQSYEDAPFWSPEWSICPKHFFFFNYYHSHLPISLCKILKKFFQRIQSYEDAQFLGPKWPISPNVNFFRKPRLGRKWRAIARTHAHTRHMFNCAIIVCPNFV